MQKSTENNKLNQPSKNELDDEVGFKKAIKNRKRIYDVFYKHLEKYAFIIGIMISFFYIFLFDILNLAEMSDIVFIIFNSFVFLGLGYWAKSMIHYTNIDYTTKLYNRKYISIELSTWLYDINNTKPLTLLVIDIDHFKEINDQQGHLIGDEAILRVADILKSKTSKKDIVARWGGDEFVIALPNTSEEEGYLIANEIGNEVANTKIQNTNITVSTGLVTTDKKMSLDDYFLKGDNALYQAKTKRNMVVRHSTIKVRTESNI